MDTVRWIIATAPEIFLLLAVAIGTVLGRIRIAGFSIGTTACTLIVSVIIGQLGTFTFPSNAQGFSLQLSIRSGRKIEGVITCVSRAHGAW
jgi:uncharacterized transporter YbjL